MSKQASILALNLAVLTSGVPAAEAPPQEAPPIAGLPFNAFLSADEMRQLFDYMRNAMIAAMQGERYRMPPELAHTLARVQERIMRQGNAAVRQMMELLRNELDRALEEMKPPAPEPRPERTRG